MMATAVAVALVVLLLAGGIYGPRLLAAAAATLSRYPRLSMGVWSCAAALWTLALLLVGPVLTWIITGPALPGATGVACQRCLAAANPFAQPVWDLGVPAIVLLAIPILLTAALVVRGTVRHVLGRSRVRAFRRLPERAGECRTLHGVDIRVAPEAAPDVYCLPGLGVVVTRGALASLSDLELATVLAHEQAHLSQRHHLLLGIMTTLRDVLGWVPLLRAAPAAVGEYAEMAADDAARRERGTTALVSALLSLGAHRADSPVPRPASALHVADGDPTWRVRRLACDDFTPVAPLARIGGCLATLATVVVAISVPYLAVAFGRGC